MTLTASRAALWLADHVSAIAAEESAGDIYAEIKRCIDEIERCINRPIHGIECGPCPTLDEDQRECAVGLTAKRGAIEVRCWKCKTTHNIERLIQRRLNEVPNRLFNARDVLKIMARIGEPIGESTWRRWRAVGTITPAGELYGEPGYRLQDVKDQRRRYARHDRAC